MRLTQDKEAGSSLIEFLVALLLIAILLFIALQQISVLYRQHLKRQQTLSLTRQLDDLALILEKQIQRAGYCYGHCQGQSLHLGQMRGEAVNSCIVVAYDGKHRGKWFVGSARDSDYFGYRLNKGKIEMQRGVTSCSGSRWETITLADEFQVSRFYLRQITSFSAQWIDIDIHLSSKRNPNMGQQRAFSILRLNR